MNHATKKHSSYRLAIATHRKRIADAITPIIKKACSNWLVKDRRVVWHKRHVPTAPLWRWQSQFCSFAVLGSNASQRLDTEVQRVAEVGGQENNVSLDDVTCHPHGSLTKGDSNYSVSLCSTIRARSLAEREERDSSLTHTLQLVPG